MRRAVRLATIRLARLAAERGDHTEAERLFSAVGIQYLRSTDAVSHS